MSTRSKIDALGVVEEGEKWLDSLARQRTILAIEKSIMATLIVLLSVSLIVLLMASVATNLPSASLIVQGLLLAIPIALVASYLFLKSRRIGEITEWRNRLANLKRTENLSPTSSEALGETPYRGVLESGLELIDQMSVWAREIAEGRIKRAWSYGVISFLLAFLALRYLLTGFSPIGFPNSFFVLLASLVVGQLVVYGRRRTMRKEVERRTKMLEDWRHQLQKDKDEFVQRL